MAQNTLGKLPWMIFSMTGNLTVKKRSRLTAMEMISMKMMLYPARRNRMFIVITKTASAMLTLASR